MTTTETLNGLDLEAMWINALTSCCMDRVKLPPAFASEREAIQAGLKICWQPGRNGCGQPSSAPRATSAISS